MSAKTMLEDEIMNRLEELEELKIGSEEYRVATDSICKMMDRSIEIDKMEQDAYDKAKSREIDSSFKEEQLASEERSRWINNIITGGGILLSTGVTIWGTLKSLKFEETGSVTTIMGRGFIQKLLPKK